MFFRILNTVFMSNRKKQKISMALIRKEDFGWTGRARLAGKKFDSIVSLVSRVFIK